jgi:MYXO-CTERM domain-containing protein
MTGAAPAPPGLLTLGALAMIRRSSSLSRS